MMLWMLTAWAHWAPCKSDSLKLVFQSWYCSGFHWQEIKTQVTFGSAILAPTDLFLAWFPRPHSAPTPSLSITLSLPLSCLLASSPLSLSSPHSRSPNFRLSLNFLRMFPLNPHSHFSITFMDIAQTWLHFLEICSNHNPSLIYAAHPSIL